MSARWYISATAVRQYAAAVRLDPEDEAQFDRAEEQLFALCEKAHFVKVHETDADKQYWRTGRPLRLTLVVSTSKRPEGDLPQLIGVVARR